MPTALHQRKRIRDAVAASLVAAGTSVGTRVFKTQMVPWRREELPLIGVSALSETSDDGASAPRELERELDLVVVGVIEADEDTVDDDLDALALEVERVMHADETFGGVCGDSVLTGSEMAVDVDGKKPVGFIRLTYKVTYYTGAPDAEDVALDDLKTVDTAYNFEGQQAPADETHDTITGLEV